MIQITKTQSNFLQYIIDHPGSTIAQIREGSGLPPTSAGNNVRELVMSGLVKKEGNKLNRKYFYTGVSFKVLNLRGKMSEEDLEAGISELDMFLQDLAATTLTKKQISFIKANKNKMSRRQLAKELGIGKLELNQALIKLKINVGGIDQRESTD